MNGLNKETTKKYERRGEIILKMAVTLGSKASSNMSWMTLGKLLLWPLKLSSVEQKNIYFRVTVSIKCFNILKVFSTKDLNKC